MNLPRVSVLSFVMLCAMLCSCAPHTKVIHMPVTEGPKAPREFRAVWWATVANIDWPSDKNLTVEQQKKEMVTLLDQCAAMRLNAVVFQVRPQCDALYDSKFEPWSAFLTGAQGKAPEPFYDPLEFLVEESHKRGIEVHTWFNPYRAHHPSDKSEMAQNHISKTNPGIVKKYGKHLWLDPSEQDTQDHSINVIMDVVKRYDIDGVHMDDYFYPYKEKGEDGKIVDFPDDPSWEKYKAAGGKLERDDWRRDSVNKFVQRYYESVKKEKPWVKAGISPFGIWRPGYPPSVKGFDQYDELYADAKLWFEKGWVDYFTPQLYWKISAEKQPYKDLLKWWSEQNKMGRHLWPGNFTSQISNGEKGWPAEEILEQVEATRAQAGATGNVHFSMKAFEENRKGIRDMLASTVYNRPALVPASPWLSKDTPKAPRVCLEKDAAAVKLRAKACKSAWQWVVYTKKGDQWSTDVKPAYKQTELALEWANAEAPDQVALSVVNRCGLESERSSVALKGE